MANQFGYNQLFTDRPETWFADGYVSMADGYGTPSYTQVPSGIVSSIVHNSTGNYSINLAQPWYALLFVSVVSEIPSGASPALALTQLESDDVGVSATPSITFQFVDAAGAAVELSSTSGFRFLIMLKRSSA